MKGYKVTDKNRSKLIGIASNSLQQLLVKGREKLGIKEEVVAVLDDGTVIDDEDYFQSLPAQTIFILYRKNEEVVTGVDLILNVLRSVNSTYLETGNKAEDFVLNKTADLMGMLREKEREERVKILKNTPKEDPDWFADLETNSRTKDEYMFRKSQDRIRGYFYKFQDDIRKSKSFLRDPAFRKVGQDCMNYFKNRLKVDAYFGCYFDRRCATAKAASDAARNEVDEPATKKKKKADVDEADRSYDKSSYCDSSGKFVCQGTWKSDKCHFVRDHQINPYSSRETRILFSTWNLDHRIERSRSVAPALVKAIESRPESQAVNFLYFYQLLFTKINLKLVHVVCHDKAVHDVACDPKFLFV